MLQVQFHLARLHAVHTTPGRFGLRPRLAMGAGSERCAPRDSTLRAQRIDHRVHADAFMADVLRAGVDGPAGCILKSIDAPQKIAQPIRLQVGNDGTGDRDADRSMHAGELRESDASFLAPASLAPSEHGSLEPCSTAHVQRLRGAPSMHATSPQRLFEQGLLLP